MSDIEILGLGPNDDLTGFTSRMARAIAWLRESWLQADPGNAKAIEEALAVLFQESPSVKRNAEMFKRILAHDHDRAEELFDGISGCS